MQYFFLDADYYTERFIDQYKERLATATDEKAKNFCQKTLNDLTTSLHNRKNLPSPWNNKYSH